jgi:hypothetical protein
MLIRGVIAANTVLIGIHFENILKPIPALHGEFS